MAGANRASTTVVWAGETLEKLPKLRSLVEGWSWTVGAECRQVAGEVGVKL